MADEDIPPPVPVATGRQALDNCGFDRLTPHSVADRYEVWVLGNMPVNVHYAGPPWDPTHFDGEAFQNVLKIWKGVTKAN